VLRPSSNLLDSSRAAYRRGVRAERLKAVWQVFRLIKGLVARAVAASVELLLLCGLPFAYLVAAYLVVDLPARFIAHRGAYGSLGALLFAGAVAVAVIGVVRAAQDAPPIAPVRPKFAKAMLGLSWVAAALFTIGDLAL
jgi:hypothetical protein